MYFEAITKIDKTLGETLQGFNNIIKQKKEILNSNTLTALKKKELISKLTYKVQIKIFLYE